MTDCIISSKKVKMSDHGNKIKEVAFTLNSQHKKSQLRLKGVCELNYNLQSKHSGKGVT